MPEGFTRFLLVGVGGQGCVTVARILGQAGNKAGLNANVGELHGMSQRGGSVEASVIMGPGHSPMIENVGAGVVIGMEMLEALRVMPRMDSDTVVVLNKKRITPFQLTLQHRRYPSPDAIVGELGHAAGRVHALDSTLLAREADAPRAENIVLLGALAGLGLCPFDATLLRESVAEYGPPRFREANLRAYDRGKCATLQ